MAEERDCDRSVGHEVAGWVVYRLRAAGDSDVTGHNDSGRNLIRRYLGCDHERSYALYVDEGRVSIGGDRASDLLATLDRIDEAWELALPAEEHLRELGLGSAGTWLAEVAMLAGDYQAAASHMRNACAWLEAIGNTGQLSTYAPSLGHKLCTLGRPDEAEPLAERGRELGDPDDIMTQAAWRQTQALVHSARGQHADAERLACEAVELSLRSDSPLIQGNALSDLGQVLAAGGRDDQAVTAYREALDLCERKQVVPFARRTRERLAALQLTKKERYRSRYQPQWR